MVDSSGVALILSMIAIIISGLSLWKTHYEPFELNITHNNPRFKVYTLDLRDGNGDLTGEQSFLPIFDVGMTFHNTGQKSGLVNELRISTEMGPREDKETFYSEYIVDFKSFESNIESWSDVSEQSIDRDWYSILIKGNEEKSLHIVFLIRPSSQWDWQKTGDMTIKLEVDSEAQDKWVVIDQYEVNIRSFAYSFPGEKGIMAHH